MDLLEPKILFQRINPFYKGDKNKDPKARMDIYIFQHQKRLEGLLTREIIQKICDVDLDKAKIENDQFYGPPEYYTYQFIWAGDTNRVKRVRIHGKDYGPGNYKIGIGKIERYNNNPLSIFKEYHYNPTNVEMERARKVVYEEYGAFNMMGRFYKTTGVLNEGIAPLKKYEPVTGVGDAAYWDNLGGGLDVLVGHVKFQVVVDISDDVKENQHVAEKLVYEILIQSN